MTDRHPAHTTLIERQATSDEPSHSADAVEVVSAPIAPPRNYENWKRKTFSDGLMEAYHRLGGVDYLVQFGREHPADFVRACSRMIPREIRSDLRGEMRIVLAIAPSALDMHPRESVELRTAPVIEGRGGLGVGDV